MSRFRSKLAVAVLPVVVVGFAASTALAVSSAAKAQEQAVRDKGSDITEIVTTQIDVRARAAQQAVTALGGIAATSSGAGRQVIAGQVREFARVTEGVSDAYVVYEPGRGPRADGGPTGGGRLSGDGHFYVAYLRGDGAEPEAFGYTDGELAEALQGDWYRRPLTTGQLTVSPPYLDPATKVIMTSFTAPIRDASGRPTGVAGVDLPLDDLSSLIGSTRVGRSGYAMLLSASGVLLAAPPARLQTVAGATDAVGTKTLAEAVDRQQASAVAAIQARVARAGRGAADSVDPFGHEEVLLTWQRVPSTGWTLLTAVPRQEIAAPVEALRARLLLAAVAVLLAVAVALIFASARLTRHLPRVRDAALEIAQGNYDVALPRAGDDEIGEVTHAFGAIVDNLRGARERTRRFAQVQAMADVDDLTGLLNRRRFNELAPALVQAAFDDEQPLAVLMLDIDRFKAVNDTYGHLVGDEVIKEVARRLSTQLRGSDLIGRFGGEEFAVLLPEVVGTAGIPERLRACIAEAPISTRAGDLDVSISVGVGQLQPGDAVEDVIGRADRGLYLAKESGRNRVESV